MPDEIYAESSPAADSSASSTPPAAQAGTEPQSQDATSQQQVPFHQHPRFQQVIGQNRELRATVAQLQGQIAQIQQRVNSQGGATQQDQSEYREAAAALKRVIAADPELAELLEIRKQFPQAAQGMQQLQQQAARAHQAQARSHMESLIKGANLNVPAEQMPMVVGLIAQAAMRIPGGNDRYVAGDMRVLNEAFEQVKGFLEGFRKPAEVATAQTKNKLRSLPTPPRTGTPAGQPAPEKPQPGQERDFMRKLHQKGAEVLKSFNG